MFPRVTCERKRCFSCERSCFRQPVKAAAASLWPCSSTPSRAAATTEQHGDKNNKKRAEDPGQAALLPLFVSSDAAGAPSCRISTSVCGGESNCPPVSPPLCPRSINYFHFFFLFFKLSFYLLSCNNIHQLLFETSAAETARSW